VARGFKKCIESIKGRGCCGAYKVLAQRAIAGLSATAVGEVVRPFGYHLEVWREKTARALAKESIALYQSVSRRLFRCSRCVSIQRTPSFLPTTCVHHPGSRSAPNLERLLMEAKGLTKVDGRRVPVETSAGTLAKEI
jgi:hypothetical protein